MWRDEVLLATYHPLKSFWRITEQTDILPSFSFFWFPQSSLFQTLKWLGDVDWTFTHKKKVVRKKKKWLGNEMTAVSLFQYLLFSLLILYSILWLGYHWHFAPLSLLPCDTILISFNDLHLILPVFVAVGFCIHIFSLPLFQLNLLPILWVQPSYLPSLNAFSNVGLVKA